ncbi:polyprenyl synthetase family protein [Polymorphospora sp. NPDC051019]|uniref:polyprenyl synthetase family protein n=1 Tax=Polymorphospora sp. NPDC051019 TaxID=3155725 RepID=UPI003447ACD0
MTTDMTVLVEGARRDRARLLRAAEDRVGCLLAGERARWSAVHPRASVPVEAIARLVGSGGKRLRPTFCITGYLAAGGDPSNDDVAAMSAALELLHAFALIHDDVMDESAQRRGHPTVHALHSREHARDRRMGGSDRFGESVAILAGDLAHAYADAMMVDDARVRAVWDELRAELVIGQWMDVEAAAAFVTDPGLSRWIAVVKSGRYTIHRPLQLGACLAGRPDLMPAFETYGTAVGEAFQLRDDLIDLFGDAAATGKPSRSDLRQHKMTLLLSLAFERDERLRAAFMDELFEADSFVDMLVDWGVPAEVENRIADLVETGGCALSETDLTPEWRQEFEELARAVAYRDV